ncbi:hypothetical protein ACIRPS_31035 [Streptomyces griseoviridis]
MSNTVAREFSFLTPDDLGGTDKYEKFCTRTGLDPIPGGYGCIHAVRGDERVSLLTTDVEYVRLLVSATPEARAGLRTPPQTYLERDGWPDQW